MNGPQYPERDAAIARLVDEGEMTLEDIGARYGITRERARQVAKRLGSERHWIPTPARPRIVPGRVCRYCDERVPLGRRRTHNKDRGHGWALSLDECGLVAEAYRVGLGYEEIARIFGVTHMTVKRHIVRMGLTRHATGEYPRDPDHRQALVAAIEVLRSAAAA